PVPKRMNKLGTAGKPGAGSWWSADPAEEATALEAAHHEAEVEQRAILSEYQERVHGTPTDGDGRTH
ncbi:MAG: cytochrome b, partial [Acidobacteria bacterium]